MLITRKCLNSWSRPGCLPVAQWTDIQEYQKMKHFFQHLAVANDPAERSVKLIEDFALKATHF